MHLKLKCYYPIKLYVAFSCMFRSFQAYLFYSNILWTHVTDFILCTFIFNSLHLYYRIMITVYWIVLLS